MKVQLEQKLRHIKHRNCDTRNPKRISFSESSNEFQTWIEAKNHQSKLRKTSSQLNWHSGASLRRAEAKVIATDYDLHWQLSAEMPVRFFVREIDVVFPPGGGQRIVIYRERNWLLATARRAISETAISLNSDLKPWQW